MRSPGGDILPFCDSSTLARAMQLFAAMESDRTLAATARTVGLPTGLTDGEPLFLPVARCALWMELAARRLGDRHFGAFVGRQIRYDVEGPYGDYVMQAPTLLRALARVRMGLPLVANEARIATQIVDGHLVVAFRHGVERALGARHVNERFPVLVTDLVRSYCGPDWRPGWVALPEIERGSAVALGDIYGGCDVRPSEAAAIAIPIADLHASSALSPSARGALTLRDLPALMRGRAPTCLEDAARQAIRAGPRQGDASADTVAAMLGLGVRTLQRRMRTEGLSFRRLRLEETHSRALALLRDSDAPIGEIGHALGYDEPRSFRRAFHARFGTSPSEVRARRRNSEARWRIGDRPTLGPA